MAVLVKIPMPLRRYTDGEATWEVEAAEVAVLLEKLAQRFPKLAPRLLGPDGDLHEYINLFVNGDDIRDGDGLATPLRPGDEVILLPPAAGGTFHLHWNGV